MSLSSQPSTATIEQSLNELIHAAYSIGSHNESSGADLSPFSCIQLCVDTPGFDVPWHGAVGSTAIGSDDVTTTQHPMRIASTSKTFVAAAILRLWEQQKLGLDAGIDDYISAMHQQLLLNNGYEPTSITIRHLLTHTSGLFDYADSDGFYTQVTATPNRYWTRTEQLALAMELGKPYGQPGEVYRYSDTGYILLGEIIEQVYGQSLGLALRQLLDYQRLGLNRTWLETAEPQPEGTLPRIHQYVEKQDFYSVNGSCDIFGGGGLVSTVGDMARFMRALFSHQVYANPTTLTEMLTTVAAKAGGPAAHITHEQIPGTYRLGIDGGVEGKVYHHGGYYGTFSAYIPSRDVVFSFSINQHFCRPTFEHLLSSIYGIFGVEA